MDQMDDKVFDLLTQMYSEINVRFDKINIRFDKVENQITKTNVLIENSIMPKLEALFDGHQQNTSQLERLAAEVKKHDEVIIRRIK